MSGPGFTFNGTIKLQAFLEENKQDPANYELFVTGEDFEKAARNSVIIAGGNVESMIAAFQIHGWIYCGRIKIRKSQ